jgi:transposase InsO family protein
VVERLFREYGLTDNGSPFASTSIGRSSRLLVRWLKLGIQLERIAPGHPELNGSHERMHRSSVHSTGGSRWRGTDLFVSEALVGERVGLEEVEEGIWSVYG